MDIIFVIVITAITLLVCYIIGRSIEKKHYRSIEEREKRYQHILVFNERTPSPNLTGQPFYLVTGSVVMSSDYFKQYISMLKAFFGGRLSSYEKMMDMGRREAILRMKEDAYRKGATIIFNVRLETAMLNQAQKNQNQIVSSELFAYGTAWIMK